jgi:hypothetical protein
MMHLNQLAQKVTIFCLFLAGNTLEDKKASFSFEEKNRLGVKTRGRHAKYEYINIKEWAQMKDYIVTKGDNLIR